MVTPKEDSTAKSRNLYSIDALSDVVTILMTAKKNSTELQTRGAKPKITPEIAEKVFDFMAEGVSVRKIGLMTGFPSARTIHRYVRQNPEFCQQYAHAREEQAEFFADRIYEVATTPRMAEEKRISDEGTVVVIKDDVQARRLEVDSLKWLASKHAPKKYGERLFNEITAQISIEERNTLQTSFNEAIGFGRVIEHDTAEDSEGITRT